MLSARIELASHRWQRRILPLNHDNKLPPEIESGPMALQATALPLSYRGLACIGIEPIPSGLEPEVLPLN